MPIATGRQEALQDLMPARRWMRGEGRRVDGVTTLIRPTARP